MYTTLPKCKKSLAIIWFVGSGVIFMLIFLQTMFGKFSGEEDKAWGWFLPTVMPTLSLIIGVLVMDTRRGLMNIEKKIDPFLYRLAMSLSGVYFFVILASIIIQPFTSMTILNILERSNLWLGPLQGLVAASIGAFFIKGE